jgi:hypothetical protein
VTLDTTEDAGMLKRLRDFRIELLWLLLIGGMSALLMAETGVDGHEEDFSSICPPGGCECFGRPPGGGGGGIEQLRGGAH